MKYVAYANSDFLGSFEFPIELKVGEIIIDVNHEFKIVQRKFDIGTKEIVLYLEPIYNEQELE